jgi:iron-regulated transporter 1
MPADAPPDARARLRLLCMTHGLRCTGDRAWSFILPLVLASSSPNSLGPTSALSMAQTAGIILLGPVFARSLGDSWRQLALLVLVENCAVVCAGLIIASLGQGDVPLLSEPLFGVALVLLAVDAAASSALSLLVEKEYCRRLFSAPLSSANELARANAAVTRADLASSVATYTVIGAGMRRLGDDSGAAMMRLLWLWHAFAACCVLGLLRRLRGLLPASVAGATTATAGSRSGRNIARGSAGPVRTTPPSALRALFDAPSVLGGVSSAVRWHVLAFALLFFTVLSPSGLLSAHLRSRGVAAEHIATFRAAAQAAGAVGTGVAPWAIGRWGAAGAAWRVQLGQCCLLWAGALAYACPPSLGRHLLLPSAFSSVSSGWRELALMISVVASRVGLWGFDLCERQIVQAAAAPAGDAVHLFSVERALAEGAGLAMTGLSLWWSAPEQFANLLALSLAAVSGSAWLLRLSRRGAGARGDAARAVGSKVKGE